MIYDKIFIIDSNGTLTINKPEIRKIFEFKTLLVRDRGSEGDSDGRKKIQAEKEFVFIAAYYGRKSIYRELGDKKRFRNSKRLSHLPEKWKPDKEVQLAGKKYIEEETKINSLYIAYLNAARAVDSLGEDIAFYDSQKDRHKNYIKTKLKELDNTDLEEEKQKLEQEIDVATGRLQKLSNNIMTTSNKLPILYDTIKTLKDKIFEAEGSDTKLFGGGTLGRREE